MVVYVLLDLWALICQISLRINANTVVLFCIAVHKDNKEVAYKELRRLSLRKITTGVLGGGSEIFCSDISGPCGLFASERETLCLFALF